MENFKKVAEDSIEVEGTVPVKGTRKITQSIFGEEKPLTKREMEDLAKKIARNEKKNARRTFNREFQTELKKISEEKKAAAALAREQNPDAGVPKNKSQLRTIEIRDNAAAEGTILTIEEAGLIKREENIQKQIVTPIQGLHYFRTLEARVGRKGMYIILAAKVIWIIKPSCPMPPSARPYQVRVKQLIKAQTDDDGGYFSTPFSGLTTLGTKNGLLLTAIENKMGSEAILAAMAVVKIPLDLLIAYVLALCLADQTNAAAIIASAGMAAVKEKAVNTKPELTLKQGATGVIKLNSLAAKYNGKRCTATYYWQYGLMVAGVLVWYDLPDTNVSRTTATGMPTGVAVFFRRAYMTTRGGRSPWSAPKPISPV